MGIIRCQQTEDMCQGSTCFKMATGAKLLKWVHVETVLENEQFPV